MTLATDIPQRPTPGRFALIRQPFRALRPSRLFLGGRLGDAGRLPRYAGFLFLGLASVWAPITGYLKTTPPSFTSTASLILPGSGVSASVNLADIGQASSFASSAYSSSSISPTETYKRLIGADRVIAAAADALSLRRTEFGVPRVQLVDQTGFIHVEMTAGSPSAAQARGDALLAAFFAEIERLRSDEMEVRETGREGALGEYRDSVRATRDAISELRATSGLYSVAQYNEHVMRHDRARDALAELAADLGEAEEQVSLLSRQLGLSPTQAAASLKLFADREYMASLAELSGLVTAEVEARAKYGKNHPKMRESSAAVSATRTVAMRRGEALTGLTTDALAALDLAPDGARADLLADLVQKDSARAGRAARYAEKRSEFDTEGARLDALAPLAAELEDLSRDFDVAEAVFASAIARAQSTKADVFASYPLVQILEDPSLPERASSPNTKLAIAGGVAASLMLIIGLALGWVRRAVISRLIAQPPASA
ncbi:GumC family protein [Litorisediminicola beolgyonensis]|uniref:GumC family protein n=1 Tax=Litorisediminicola beolgyonensis TaxID=1173614 RepID=A0ABW3ZDA2_9RHOB